MARMERELTLYATELGRKRELLPLDLSGCRATIERAEGTVFYWSNEMTVRFERPKDAKAWPIEWVHIASVTVRNLNAWPDQPSQEAVGEAQSGPVQSLTGEQVAGGARW